ncbi:transcriptional regulator PadR [Kutzneria sp. 744]|nr:transcriptional regulator PadR [Kutzneria sp. 744]
MSTTRTSSPGTGAGRRWSRRSCRCWPRSPATTSCHPPVSCSPPRTTGDLGGCGGFRVLSPGVAELTRVFLRPTLRGRGGALALLTALERAAVDMGLTTARLDTRKDLVEARRLYARNGYVEIPAYNSSPYADHWFEKRLA